MINTENLYKLYAAMMKVDDISTKEIKELGFTQANITNFVSEGYLIRVQRGYYNFGNIDSLYLYGKSLVCSKRFLEGIKVFERCHLLDPTNVFFVLQLLVYNVKEKKYDELLKYFDILYQSDNKNKKYLYYLFLLSYIIELPDNYKKVVKSMDMGDMMVEDSSPYGIMLNNIVSLVYNGKLTYAYANRTRWHVNKSKTDEDYADIIILKEAVSVHAENKKKIDQCIIEDKYEEAIDLIDKESNIRELPLYNKYVKYLLKDLVKMNETRTVPHKVTEGLLTSNLFVAIDNYDYELALKINENHNRSNNVDNSKSMIFIILEKIIKLKNEILETQNVIDNSDENVILDEPVESVADENLNDLNNNENVEISVDKDVSYAQLVSLLLISDVESFRLESESYLRQIDKSKYYSFIISLTEICRLKNVGYSKVLVILTQIVDNSFEFNSSEYLTLFYESISKKEYEIGELYLVILEVSEVFDNKMIIELKKVIELLRVADLTTEEEIKIEESQNLEDQEIINLDEMSLEDNQIDIKVENSREILEQKTRNVPKISEEYRQDTLYINNKLKLLRENRGVILLKPMDSARRKRIHHIISRKREATTFSIGSLDNRRIVIRYIGNVYVDLKETIRLADEAYYKRKYDVALKGYLDLLATNNPKTFVYAKIGLTYMKMFDIDQAILYLTIATELSKINNEQFDFTDLIASLDGSISEDEKKPKVKMSLDDFHDDTDLGVLRIDEMLIYKDVNGLDYKNACEQLGFTYEEYLLSMLVLAKRAFFSNNEEQGNKFLKVVERADNKSRNVVKHFLEIQKNKRFYKNRNIMMIKKDS